MRLNQMLNVLVLVAGLHATGCAVDDPASEDQTSTADPTSSADQTSTATSDLEGGVPTGVRCSDKTWVVDFFNDAAHTTLVGKMSCNCFQPQLLAGVTSSFAALEFEFVCDFN